MAKKPKQPQQKKISPEEQAWNQKVQEKISNSTKWTCEAEIEKLKEVKEIDRNLQHPALQPQKLTVGQEFIVKCKGSALALDPKKLKLNVTGPYASREQLKYLLVWRDWKTVSEEQVSFKAVSYKASEISMSFFLEDGENIIFIPEFNFALESVIPQGEGADTSLSVLQKYWKKFIGKKTEKANKAETAQQQPTPYPPYVAVKVAYPSWYWWTMGLFLVLALSYLFVKLKRSLELKRLFKELEEHQTALGAYHQMHKDIRSLEKNYFPPKMKDKEYVEQLNHIFRLFLVRQLRVPALIWSDANLLSYIEKKYPSLDFRVMNKLKVLLRELKDNQIDSVSENDASQLLKTSQTVCKNLYDQTKGGK